MKKSLFGIALFSLPFMLGSCIDSKNEDNELTLLNEQVAAIDAHLAGQNAIKDITGVSMVIHELGGGFPSHGNTGSSFRASYEGRLFDTGQIFDQGTNKTFKINEVIDGWKVAFTSLPAGSRATIYIPSYFGYKAAGSGTAVPPDAILVFDVHFVDVIKTSAEIQRLASDTVAIDNYLASKSIEAIKDPTGMRYEIIEQGSGAVPDLYDKVKFHITYRLLSNDAVVVGEYDLAPSSTSYNRVVDMPADGLKLGLTKMAVGSKAKFYLPSSLAYGEAGAGDGVSQIIPPNANIIVEVQLTQIVVE